MNVIVFAIRQIIYQLISYSSYIPSIGFCFISAKFSHKKWDIIFPDEHTKFGKNNEVISGAQRYACIGNAVNSKVVKVIFDKLRDVLIDRKQKVNVCIICSFVVVFCCN
jgi:hypothetical protein